MAREPDREKLAPETETALAKAAREGETQALDELISAYWSDFQRMAYAFCGDAVDAFHGHNTGGITCPCDRIRPPANSPEEKATKSLRTES